MKSRHKRIAWIVLGLAIIGIAVGLVLKAFQSNLVFFFTPTQVAANEARGFAPVVAPFVHRRTLNPEQPRHGHQILIVDRPRCLFRPPAFG